MADDTDTPLADYNRPSMAVDAVILTVSQDRLCVVVMDGPTKKRRLPGGFVHDAETLAAALSRVLKAKIGLALPRLEQLHVFDAPRRDPRGWVMSAAHVAVVNERALESANGIFLLPLPLMTSVLDQKALGLDFDHDDMVWMAVDHVRESYGREPDPWGVLEVFTLAELRQLHLAIDRNTAERDTFRRTMEPLLIETEQLSTGAVGRPSRMWRRPTPEERSKLLAKAATPSSRSKLSEERKSTRPRGLEFERILSVMKEQGLGEKEAMELYQSLRSQRREISASRRNSRDDRVFGLITPDSLLNDRVERSRSLTDSGSRSAFQVLVRWVSGETVRHEKLREREANRIYDELVREFASATYDATSDYPVYIELTSDDGAPVRSDELSSRGSR